MVRARKSFATKTAPSTSGLRLLVLSFVGTLFALGVASVAGANTQAAPTASAGPGPSFAIADFDGDRRPDLARVDGGQVWYASTNYLIQFELTTSGRHAIQVLAPAGGLAIEARDVNGDHAVDLVLTTARLRQPVAVLLNDGHGGFFRAEPGQFPGAFGESPKGFGSSSNESTQAVGIPPQSRSGICSDATNLPDVRGPTDSISVSGPEFLPASFLIAYAGRAPPFEVSYL